MIIMKFLMKKFGAKNFKRFGKYLDCNILTKVLVKVSNFFQIKIYYMDKGF